MFKEGNMFCRFAKRFWWRQDNLSSLLPFAKRSWSLVRQKEPSCELNTKKHPPCISYDTPASTTSSSDGENPSLWAGFRAMDSAAHQIHRFLQCSLSEVQVSSLGFSFGLVIRFEPPAACSFSTLPKHLVQQSPVTSKYELTGRGASGYRSTHAIESHY